MSRRALMSALLDQERVIGELRRQIAGLERSIDGKDLLIEDLNHQIDGFKELNDEVNALQDGGDTDRILAETSGFVFAYACDSLDKGIDPRTVEFPEVLEAAQKAILDEKG